MPNECGKVKKQQTRAGCNNWAAAESGREPEKTVTHCSFKGLSCGERGVRSVKKSCNVSHELEKWSEFGGAGLHLFIRSVEKR